MSAFNLVSTVKFVNSHGHEAKYEIYFDPSSGEYHAEIFHIARVTAQGFSAHTVSVWHRINTSYQRIPGSNIQALEHSCQNHFNGK